MSDLYVPGKRYTVEEYFELEARGQEKLEFYNGKINPMPGASLLHNLIVANTIFILKSLLRDQKLLISTSDTKIRIPSINRFVYPDAVVICEKPEFYEGRNDTILNPLLVVEVLSPSTEEYDRGEKFHLYRTLPSFREYVLIDQERPFVSSYWRSGENTWRITDVLDPEQSIFLEAIGVSLPLAEVYREIRITEL